MADAARFSEAIKAKPSNSCRVHFVPMRKRELDPLTRSTSASEIVKISCMSSLASSRTMAVISLVIEAIGTASRTFRAYKAAPLDWSTTRAEADRKARSVARDTLCFAGASALAGFDFFDLTWRVLGFLAGAGVAFLAEALPGVADGFETGTAATGLAAQKSKQKESSQPLSRKPGEAASGTDGRFTVQDVKIKAVCSKAV